MELPKKEFNRPEESRTEESYKGLLHKAVVFVQNTELAAALEAMDIPLRNDPPRTHRIEGGKRIVFWHMEQRSTCGRWETIKLVKAWKRDVEFYLDPANRDHPFKRIMVAFNNRKVMTHFLLHEDKPYRVFNLEDGCQLFVIDGSRRFKALVEGGLKPL